ncbi:MAG: oxygen-independent coproporphyrinogen III oxidase, partial [Proteobacteria bacterium]|nr:oxygen-independent coproporphyrinogen III oxidase [Pseudomonadota bacterium]
HWGGGTPTFLSEGELTELMQMIREGFDLDPNGEHSIEVDPRKVGEQKVALLGELGMNRISVGVQDFNPEVQRAINRIQSVEETIEVIEAARKHGFKSVNTDLIYGLPKQTLAGFGETLAQVIKCSPDRIALYNYAHLPAVFKPQRRILDADMPQPEVKLQLMISAIETLLAAGYIYIGMDHFSKPDDDLAVAQRQGRLYRNFQGYSTYGDCDLIGLGVSAIGKIGPTYCQNVRTLEEYYDRLDNDLLPVMRGIEVTADDLVRRAVIQALSCHFELSMEAIGIAHLIDFKSYFAVELEELRSYAKDGLVEIDGDWIVVTPSGRLLVRILCMVFDKYLRQASRRASYSKVI